ncbi:Flagellar motor protein MotA [uncultured Gammaproteobacteria bacterium]
MSRPRRHLTRMLLFLVMVAGVAALLWQPLQHAFIVNPALNGLILGVLVFGIFYIFRQVTRLGPETRWVGHFQSGRPGIPPRGSRPVLLGPLANMLDNTKRGRLTLSAPAMRSMLDGLSARLDESRELSRYLTGLLIFLGLLGTFWGLLGTIRSVAGVIAGLTIESGDMALVFGNLQRGLEAPLNGMGTAFSASLFGLAGSLVLGFLELQATQAQNLFFQEIENWLSAATRPGGGGQLIEGSDQPMPAYLQALMEQTAENLDTVQRVIVQAEENRRSAGTALVSLAEKLSELTDQVRSSQSLMVKLAESQVDIKPLLARLAEAGAAGGLGIDEASRLHLRNLDLSMTRLIDEVATGRAQAVHELRNDIRLIARTIAALAEETEQR